MARPATSHRSSAILLFNLAFLLSISLPVAALEAGDRAPDFAIPALSGSGMVGLSEYRGKIVYLDFWASWCAPCLVALPTFETLRHELPERQFQVLAVNLDRDLERARKFLRDHKVGYPSGTDPEGQVADTFELDTMPTSFLIDRNGVVRYVHRGFRNGDIDEIRAQIRKLLRKR